MMRYPFTLERMRYLNESGTVIYRPKLHTTLNRNYQLMPASKWLRIPRRNSRVIRRIQLKGRTAWRSGEYWFAKRIGTVQPPKEQEEFSESRCAGTQCARRTRPIDGSSKLVTTDRRRERLTAAVSFAGRTCQNGGPRLLPESFRLAHAHAESNRVN